MTTLSQNFSVRVGDDKRATFTITVGGVVADLSSVQTVKWRAARFIGSEVILAKDLDDGIEFVTDGSDGKVRVIIEADDTAGLLGNYTHETEIVDVDGSVSTVAAGIMTVLPELIEAAS